MQPKTPFLSTDGIVKIYDNLENFLGIVLIQRKNRPLGLALPGGFVDVGESVEDSVVREMKEEISLDVKIQDLFGVYSEPRHNERFHTASKFKNKTKSNNKSFSSIRINSIF